MAEFKLQPNGKYTISGIDPGKVDSDGQTVTITDVDLPKSLAPQQTGSQQPQTASSSGVHTFAAPTGFDGPYLDTDQGRADAKAEADARANVPGEARQFGYYAGNDKRLLVGALNSVSPAPAWIYMTPVKTFETGADDRDQKNLAENANNPELRNRR